MRSNLVIAIGDLAFRFPNLLEPWTPHMYRALADSDTGEAVPESGADPGCWSHGCRTFIDRWLTATGSSHQWGLADHIASWTSLTPNLTLILGPTFALTLNLQPCALAAGICKSALTLLTLPHVLIVILIRTQPTVSLNLTHPEHAPAAGVRKNALMVLTHLILNDMMKVRPQALNISMSASSVLMFRDQIAYWICSGSLTVIEVHMLRPNAW